VCRFEWPLTVGNNDILHTSLSTRFPSSPPSSPIPGDLHGHGQPATLQTGKKRQAYQGGVGRSPTIFLVPFYFLLFFWKNDPILSKIHLRNHNKKKNNYVQ